MKIEKRERRIYILTKVIKRDGRKVDFDRNKIIKAVLAAFNEVDGEITTEAKAIQQVFPCSVPPIIKNNAIKAIGNNRPEIIL